MKKWSLLILLVTPSILIGQQFVKIFDSVSGVSEKPIAMQVHNDHIYVIHDFEDSSVDSFYKLDSEGSIVWSRSLPDGDDNKVYTFETDRIRFLTSYVSYPEQVLESTYISIETGEFIETAYDSIPFVQPPEGDEDDDFYKFRPSRIVKNEKYTIISGEIGNSGYCAVQYQDEQPFTVYEFPHFADFNFILNDIQAYGLTDYKHLDLTTINLESGAQEKLIDYEHPITGGSSIPVPNMEYLPLSDRIVSRSSSCCNSNTSFFIRSYDYQGEIIDSYFSFKDFLGKYHWFELTTTPTDNFFVGGETIMNDSIADVSTGVFKPSIIKFNKQCEPQWFKQINFESFGVESSGAISYLQELSDGRIIASGYINNPWSGSPETHLFIMSLDAEGNYLDQANLTQQVESLFEPEQLSLIPTLETPVFCAGDATAVIQLHAAGGTPPYRYQLGVLPLQEEAVFSNFSAGEYQFKVIDNDEQVVEEVFTVYDKLPLTFSFQQECDEIEFNPVGGTRPLYFSIDGGETYYENSIFKNVENGAYELVVKDKWGCITDIQTVEVDFLLKLGIYRSNIGCHGQNTGEIGINANGRFPPFQYSLNDGPLQESNFFENLSAGSYLCSVVDSLGNKESKNIILSEPDPISTEISIMQNEITINSSGGGSVHRYSIDGGQTFSISSTFSDLENGFYYIQVKDSNDCFSEIDTVFVNPSLMVDYSVSHVSCNSFGDGSVTIAVEGIEPPFQFKINNEPFQDSGVFENLVAGTYEFRVRNNLGVLAEETIVITQELPINFSVDITDHVNIYPSGGTGNYQYSIDGGINYFEQSEFNISNGDYLFIVKDSDDCLSDTQAITIDKPMVIDVDKVDASCFEELDGMIAIIVNFGYAPYEYSLDGGLTQQEPLFDNLAAGNYELEVKDSINDIMLIDVMIHQPNAVIIEVEASDSYILIEQIDGNGDLVYSIDGGDTFEDNQLFTDLAHGDYEVIAKDELGCLSDLHVVNVGIGSSVMDQSTYDVSIYPNPTRDVVYISSEGKELTTLHIEVISLTGKAVFELDIDQSANSHSLDLRHLPSGVYLIKVTDFTQVESHAQIVHLID